MANKLDNLVSKLTGSEKYWTHWQWYKSFFGESIFKFFVSFISLLPIIAKIFQQPQSTNSALPVETHIKHVFSWELLWFAAIVYLIAYCLYLVYCPRFIKTYSNLNDYESYSHSPRWLVWLSKGIITDKSQLPKFFTRLETKKYVQQVNESSVKLDSLNKAIVLENQTIIQFKYESNYYQFAMPILNAEGKMDKDNTELAVQEIFWEIFGRLSSSKKYARLIIIILLYGCALLFAFVIIQYLFSMLSTIF